MDSLEGYVSDDELAIPALTELGWDVSTISWRDPSVDWNDFEITVIRTPWDYQRHPAEFLSVLSLIDGSRSRLENSLDIIKWNLSKRYLRDLEAAGVPVVPTLWDESYNRQNFTRWQEDLASKELILKPTISATAEDTYRLREFDSRLEDIFRNRDFMVQPFMPEIVEEGEYSLFYFNGEFSHSILKTPKLDDFRVQEEHGGIITSIVASADLIGAGAHTMKYIGEMPLYARIDLVRSVGNRWLLMELELIEPALYFRMDAGSSEKFAHAMDSRMKCDR
jgi:hypothetical protein